MEEVKIGILGAGGITKVHASKLVKNPRMNIMGIANIESERVASLEKRGYVEEDRRFIDALVNGTEPPVAAADAYHSAQLIEAIYESAKKGKEIDIS